MNFAKRLRKLREAKGLTQAELGKLLGLSKQAISSYEAAGIMPNSETLQKLAEYFNVSIDWLLGRTDDPNPPVAWLGREDNDPLKDLPEEARRSVLEFIEYVKAKYQKKGDQ